MLNLAIGFMVGGLVGYVGGACYGWLIGVKETEIRWSDAVKRADDCRCYHP